MTTKQLIKQEQGKIKGLLLQKLVSREFSVKSLVKLDEYKDIDVDVLEEDIAKLEKKLADNKQEIDKDIKTGLENDLEELNDKRSKYEEYLAHKENIKKAKDGAEDDVWAYNTLEILEKELNELL